MYTTQIGKKFLKLYNQKTGKNLTALEFFEKKFFPIMFDAEDHLQLMLVCNSPFFQPAYARLAEKEGVSVPQYRKEKFKQALLEVEADSTQVHGGIGVGFMAGDLDKSTSGQVSNIDLKPSRAEILHSWFGGALGVGFGGGYDLLFNNSELIWFVFQGWKYYRKYLQETSNVKGRQIETWNGLWLTYGLEYKNNLDRAYQNILDNSQTGKQGKYIRLKRPKWSEQVFRLAKDSQFGLKQQLVYIYSYGQMNNSLGFFYLNLDKVRRMPELFRQLIDKDSKLTRSQVRRIEQVYKTCFTFEQACAMGGIGVKSMKPRRIMAYQAGTKTAKQIRLNTDNRRLTFINYLTWIEAMINNEQTLKLAEELARQLVQYEGKEKRLRTRIKKVENLWESYKRQQFINQLAEIIDEEPKMSENLNQVVEQLMMEVPRDQFKLFSTLVKFKYYYYQNN